jgi:hypothetical protein
MRILHTMLSHQPIWGLSSIESQYKINPIRRAKS